MKGKNGITLIALIITIIVMLILVAVTITIAVNGGLFGYAGNAVSQTETEKNKEIRLANVESNLTTDGLIDYYTKEERPIKTFVFTGCNQNDSPQIIQFEQGMTWGEWVNSKYNNDRGDSSKFRIEEWDEVTYNGHIFLSPNDDSIAPYDRVYSSTIIVPDEEYYWLD